jgi:hypothetical protein
MADSEDDENPWANWIPSRWIENKELAAEWLLETWRDESPGTYAPLSDYFLNHPAHRQRGSRVLVMLEELGCKPTEK